jgi:hypothetical protein
MTIRWEYEADGKMLLGLNTDVSDRLEEEVLMIQSRRELLV